jgi:hypothetical protein
MLPRTCRILGPRPGSRGPNVVWGESRDGIASSAALSARARQLTRQAVEREASCATGWRRRGVVGQGMCVESSCARRERGLQGASGAGTGRRGRGRGGAGASTGNAAAVDGCCCDVDTCPRYWACPPSAADPLTRSTRGARRTAYSIRIDARRCVGCCVWLRRFIASAAGSWTAVGPGCRSGRALAHAFCGGRGVSPQAG